MDAGSGAEREVGNSMITEVKKSIEIPLIVGGGIDSPKKAAEAWKAGADMIVIGTALEKNPSFVEQVVKERDNLNR